MATSGALSTSNQYVKYTISITQNSQSVANNTSNVTVSVRFYRTNTGYTTWGTGTLYCKINGTQYSVAVTSSQKITENGIVLFTKTLNIPHNADGTKTLTVSAWINHNAPLTSSEQSYSQTLTTIPRASTLTASNGTLEVAQNLTINSASSSFTHSISYKCGTANATVATKTTNTTVAFTPPDTLAWQASSGTKVTLTFTLSTYSGNTFIGSTTKTITCAIPTTEKYMPKIKGVTITEKSSIVPSGVPYVKSKSMLGIDVEAYGYYGATVTIRTTVEGVAYTGNSITTNVLNTSGELSIVTTVTDARGRKATRTDKITVYDYSAPKVSCSARRCKKDGTLDDAGDYMKIVYDMSITALNNKNARSYFIKYKKSADTNYTNYAITTSAFTASGNVILPADTGSTYEIECHAKDSFSDIKKTAYIPTTYVIFNIRADGKGFSFFKVSEKQGLEIGGDLFIQGGSSMFNPILVENGTDFDTLRTAGWYYCPTNVGTENCLNIPEKKAFYMGVFKMPSNGRLLQLFFTFDGKSIYMRYYREWGDAPAWLAWENIGGSARVIEHGSTSGSNYNYSYKKYSDGTLEVSGSVSYSNISVSNALGGWYRSNVLTPPDYPVEFSEAPDVVMSFSTHAGTGAMVWETTAAASNKPPDYYLIRPQSNSAVSGKVSIIAKGRWD